MCGLVLPEARELGLYDLEQAGVSFPTPLRLAHVDERQIQGRVEEDGERDRVLAQEHGLDHREDPSLDGFRGRPRADLDAAVDAVLKIANFVLGHPATVEELDVNPLIVCGEGMGAFVADALLVERCMEEQDG